VWIALDQGLRQATDLARILPDLEAVLSFTRDLQQRLGATGVDGISGALGLHRLLEETLGAIPRADIERALAEVDALTHTLARYADVLAELKVLRDRLGI
jgi:hypothetical protein